MADEDPWGAGDDDTTTTPAVTGGDAPPPAAAAAAAAGDAPAGEPLPEAEGQAQEDPNFRRPITLYKHWVRYVIQNMLFVQRNIECKYFIFINQFVMF